jgi:hypothetical protein
MRILDLLEPGAHPLLDARKTGGTWEIALQHCDGGIQGPRASSPSRGHRGGAVPPISPNHAAVLRIRSFTLSRRMV